MYNPFATANTLSYGRRFEPVWYQGDIYIRFSRNSEENACEFVENQNHVNIFFLSLVVVSWNLSSKSPVSKGLTN